jgi:hypothetical protein
MPLLDRPAERRASAQKVLLADEFSQRRGSQAGGQRRTVARDVGGAATGSVLFAE